MSRSYVLKRRAESMEDTRSRIVQAAVDLHGTIGPARTTISAIAEHAGVERLTVYRHFPEEATLFAACSAHWLARNPPPDPGPWIEIADPEARLRRALGNVYAYYRRSAAMLRNTLRDAALVPALATAVAGWDEYLKTAVDLLARGWPSRGRRSFRRAVIGHALDFHVWSSFAARDLPERIAIELMVQCVRASDGGLNSRPD